MSKIHLEVEIPGNAKTYEFMLDDRMKIGTAKKQIMKQIAELEGHDLFAGLDNIVFGSLLHGMSHYPGSDLPAQGNQKQYCPVLQTDHGLLILLSAS